jgi:ABC-type multidrug transport system fused ATPase/permease subunit
MGRTLNQMCERKMEITMEMPVGTTRSSAGWRIRKRGATISVGQRQRISIARAFLRDAPILILDEFTSALDAETERTVRGSLQDLRKGKTTLVVSHHPQVLADADRVILLEKGRITAEGPYRDLAGQGLIKELPARAPE